jgi:hypothetical protein
VRAFGAAGGPHADLSGVGSGRDGASGDAGEATAGTGRGAGIGATLGTLLGSGAGLMAGIGALPVPGAGPVVAAGWLVAVLTGAGVGAGVGAAAGGLLGSLTGVGGDEGDAHVHAEAARRGGTALPARAEEAEAERLEAVLAGGGGRMDAAPHRAEHRAEGWTRPGLAAPHHTASGVQPDRKRRVRVHGAHAAADAAVRLDVEAVQQEGSRSASEAPPQGAEATAGTAPSLEAERKRRVRVYGAHAAADVAIHQAVQQRGRFTSEAPRQGAEVTADAAFRGSKAEAEPARQGAQAVVESQRRSAQDLAEPVEDASREVAEAAQGTTEEARRMAAPHDAPEGGPRDLQQGAAGLFAGVAQTNLRVAEELFRLSDPAPLMELQQRFAREYTDTLVRNSATLVRAMRRTADEALRPLERRIEQRGRANEDDPRFQPAAE